MFLPPKGGVPAEPGRGENPETPSVAWRRHLPQRSLALPGGGDGSTTFLPPEGGVPAEPGRGENLRAGQSGPPPSPGGDTSPIRPTATLDEICNHQLVTVSPDDPIAAAVKSMEDHAIRRLPVMDNGNLVGIVSIGDLAMERDPNSALGDISAAPPNN